MATTKFPPKIELSPGVLDSIETHSYSNLTAEVGGMLVGKIESGVTHVVGFVPATSASAEQISLTFTHEVWAEILTAVNTDFPDYQIVGWYHTHPSFGLFLSQYDEFIQRNFFAEPGQVALVVDPIAGELAWFAEKGKKIEEFGREKTRRGPVRRPEVGTGSSVQKASPVKTALIAVGAATISALLVWGLTLSMTPPDTTNALKESNAKYNTLLGELSKQNELFTAVRATPVLVYNFQEGDDFAEVVLRFYGSDQSALVLKVNGLESADQVKTGTLLLLPEVPNITISEMTDQQVNPPDETATPSPSSTSTPTPASTGASGNS
jgi:proteasome lid subunit RPN8/RPN11